MKVTVRIGDTEVEVSQQESQPLPKVEASGYSITLAMPYDSGGWVGVYANGIFKWEGPRDGLLNFLIENSFIKTIPVSAKYGNNEEFPTLEEEVAGRG